MNFSTKYPHLFRRLMERGVHPNKEAGLFLDSLNYVLPPLGFRVIEEDEIMSATLDDAERFLKELDEKTKTEQ